MKTWKQMTQKEFDELKKLFELGLSNAKLKKAGLTQRSDAVLMFVEKAKSLEEYKTIQQNYYAKFRTTKEPKEITEKKDEVAAKPPVNEIQFYAQMIELLAQINKNTDRLVQLWEETPEPKKKFGFLN